MLMKAAALSDVDLETFDIVMARPEFAGTQAIAAMRMIVGTSPALSRAQENGPAVWQRVEPKMPEWAKPLIADRRCFMGAALVVERPDGSSSYWKLVFAVQSLGHTYLAVCPLHKVAAPSVHDITAPALSLDYTFAFRINYGDCRTAADIACTGADRL